MIATAEEMIEAWGEDGLTRYDSAAVGSVSMPEESKKFLVEIGLPRWNGGAILYGIPYNELPSITSIRSRNVLITGLRQEKYERYRLLGIGSEVTLRTNGQSYGQAFNYTCPDEQTEGHVVMIWKRLRTVHVKFLNSSVLHLAKFLLLEKERYTLLEQSKIKDGNGLRKVGRRIVKEMRKIDPVACEGDTAWKERLVELEYGISY